MTSLLSRLECRVLPLRERNAAALTTDAVLTGDADWQRCSQITVEIIKPAATD